MRNRSKDKYLSKSPLKNDKISNKKIKILKKEEKSPESSNRPSTTNQNENYSKENKKVNTEKELREQLDNSIKCNMDKDVNIKEAEDKIKKSIENQEELKKKIEIVKERLKKQKKIISLFKNNADINDVKIKEFEEKIKDLNSQIEKLKEKKDITNTCIGDFELVSGAMIKLGEIYWEAKGENYVTKAENSFLIKQKIQHYNGDF
jgi:chromosome segregation ATPase